MHRQIKYYFCNFSHILKEPLPNNTYTHTGLCSGLQKGAQYHYHYRARVINGAPDVNERRAAVADIRADLHVYAGRQGTIVFKVGIPLPCNRELIS